VQPSAGTEPSRRRRRTPDFLRHELAERLQKRDLLFDFLVQFYVDRRRTPIEDTSIPWDEKASPPLRVAQLRIPSCDLRQDHVQAQSQAIDRLAFSPWQGLAAHRPLGSVMRARRIAYPASAGLRTHQPEPRHLPL
jgi:hypothetical protein